MMKLSSKNTNRRTGQSVNNQKRKFLLKSATWFCSGSISLLVLLVLFIELGASGPDKTPSFIWILLCVICGFSMLAMGVISGVLYNQVWHSLADELDKYDARTRHAYEKVDELLELAKESLNNE